MVIGNTSGTYSVTTLADIEAPVAEFQFPTPYTMSEAMTVKVRGSATDYNTIVRVQIKVNDAAPFDVTPKAVNDGVKDFSSWTADVPLTALMDNTVLVITEDEYGNVTEAGSEVKVVIRQAKVASAFPDEVNPFISAGKAVLDKNGGRNRLLILDQFSDIIYAIDLATSQKTVFIGEISCRAYGIAIDSVRDKFFASCYNESSLLEFNLSDGALVAIHDFPPLAISATQADLSDFPPKFENVWGMAVDRNNGRSQLVLIQDKYPDGDLQTFGGAVVLFSLETKQFSILSPMSEQPFLLNATSVSVDGDRYLVNSGAQLDDVNAHQIIAIDALTGQHSTFSSNAVGTGDPFSALLPNGNTAALSGVGVYRSANQLFVNEELSNKLFAIDLMTGNRTQFRDLSYIESGIETSISNSEIEIDEALGTAYISDYRRNAILVVDLETAEKVILTKNANDF